MRRMSEATKQHVCPEMEWSVARYLVIIFLHAGDQLRELRLVVAVLLGALRPRLRVDVFLNGGGHEIDERGGFERVQLPRVGSELALVCGES